MTFLSIFDNGLAHLKAEKDEVEGQEDDLLFIFCLFCLYPVYIPVYILQFYLKAEKDEVEGQEDYRLVYIRQWTRPPEG